MNFLSSVYRTIKIGVSGLTGLLGVASIVTGAFFITGTSGIVLVTGGSICCAAAGFNLFDSISAHSAIMKDVKKLEENVNKFHDENILLSNNVSNLETTKLEYINQNKKLADSLKNSEQQIKKLSDLKVQYEEANNKYTQLINNEKLEIVKLKNTVDELNSLQIKFKKENEILKNCLMENEKQINELEAIKNTYIEENNKLQHNNQENEKQLETLKIQVIKLKELYNNSKELLKNLALAGDLFTQFNNTISSNVVGLQDTADTLGKTQDEFDSTLNEMKNLVERLKNTTFTDFDKNNDGIISKEEFDNAIKNHK